MRKIIFHNSVPLGTVIGHTACVAFFFLAVICVYIVKSSVSSLKRKLHFCAMDCMHEYLFQWHITLAARYRCRGRLVLPCWLWCMLTFTLLWSQLFSHAVLERLQRNMLNMLESCFSPFSCAPWHNLCVSIALAESGLCDTFQLRSPACYMLGILFVMSKDADV